MHANDLPRDLMSPGAVAALLQVHLATVYRAMKDGSLAYYRLRGRQRRISRRDALGLVRAERIEVKECTRKPGREKPEKHARENALRDLETLKRHGLDRWF